MSTPPAPPQTLGPYRIGPKIGEGDMGTVYKAQDTTDGQIIALKIMDKVDCSGVITRETAVEIMEFAASLNHAHLHPILRVIESEENNGTLAIAMPLAAKRSLADYLNSGKNVPANHAYKLISQVAQALTFLHDQEVAHGTVQPTNVLLDEKGSPALCDLPMAHVRELGLVPEGGPTELQQFYTQPNSVYHATPEIIGDIFSLGVLSYHILTGQLPFTELDPRARTTPPSPAGLPLLVHAVLLRAMSARRDLRYQSVIAFLKDLQGSLRGEVDPDTVRWFKLSDTGSLPDSENS